MSTNKGNVKTKFVDQSEPNDHICHLCDKSFKRKALLNSHCLIHMTVKDHICKDCGKAFARKSDLKMHSLIHSGVKEHICKDCGNAFIRRQDLRRHSLIHTGVKNYACKDCGKSFSQKGHLKEHYLTHTGVKGHVCMDCGKSFTLKKHLKRHSFIHSSENDISHGPLLTFKEDEPIKCNEDEPSKCNEEVEPIKCNECGECFLDKDLFIKHVSGHELAQSSSDKDFINISSMHEDKYPTKVGRTQTDNIHQKSLVNEKQNSMNFCVNLELNKEDDIIKESHKADYYSESFNVNLGVKKEEGVKIKEENEIDNYNYDESSSLKLNVIRENDCEANTDKDQEHDSSSLKLNVKKENKEENGIEFNCVYVVKQENDLSNS